MTATAELLGLVRSHGTLILAPLAVLEGPIVSIVAGYLASRGLLLLKAVIPVVILADLVGDPSGQGGRQKGFRRHVEPHRPTRQHHAAVAGPGHMPTPPGHRRAPSGPKSPFRCDTRSTDLPLTTEYCRAFSTGW